MKLISAALALSLSFGALANVDALVGKYKAKTGKGEATITKVIVEEATLFTPAKFDYVLRAQADKDNLWVQESLSVSRDGKSLMASWSGGDCDNPDCHELTDLEITVKKTSGTGAQISIDYVGFDREDGSDEETEFSGTALFIKK